MVFSDLFFLFVFIPLFALCYLPAGWIDRRAASARGDERRPTAARNAALVIFSLLFYAWGEPVYVLLMVAAVTMNWLVGLAIAAGEGRGRAPLVVGLTGNLLILGTFKYAGFFAALLHVPAPKIALPIGISFYIFQSISYLVDVYRGDARAQRRFVDLLLYISMFPQLIAGPIVRYATVADELHDRRVRAQDLADGVYRFLIGLGKKVILANQLGGISDQMLDPAGIGNLSTLGAWVGIVAFTLQIYFDFSGYSDMAIGIGRCLGFHFNENFDHPYCCDSITDFWRRWHKSLGSFFRDYVYIPLGGNRRRQALNIAVVWFLTGMWHGACWNYILWGLYFGVIVTAEKHTILRWTWIPRPLLHVYSLLLVVIGWGIFKFEVLHPADFAAMGGFFRAFFGGGAPADFDARMALMNNFWLWPAAILLCMPVRRLLADRCRRLLSDAALAATLTAVRVALSLTILVLSVALLVGATNNAFIYTRF